MRQFGLVFNKNGLAGQSQERRGAPCGGSCGHRTPAPLGTPHEREAGRLGHQLGVAGWGQLALQVLDNVEGEAAEHSDGRHLPHEGRRGDEGNVCWKETDNVRGGRAAADPQGDTLAYPCASA